MASNNTIPALKTSFLNAQARILSQPLQAEKLKRRAGDAIPENVILEVTRDVNRQIRRHSKSAYSSLAIRAVAEQIDNLYWRAAAPDPEVESQEDDGDENRILGTDDDLSKDENVARIPVLLEDLASTEQPEMDLEAQSEQFAQLQELIARRTDLKRKLASYEALLIELHPFVNPQDNIQPNLITKDGPLTTELTKLRALSLRVNGRLPDWLEATKISGSSLKEPTEGYKPREDEDAKLAAILGD